MDASQHSSSPSDSEVQNRNLLFFHLPMPRFLTVNNHNRNHVINTLSLHWPPQTSVIFHLLPVGVGPRNDANHKPRFGSPNGISYTAISHTPFLLWDFSDTKTKICTRGVCASFSLFLMLFFGSEEWLSLLKFCPPPCYSRFHVPVWRLSAADDALDR